MYMVKNLLLKNITILQMEEKSRVMETKSPTPSIEMKDQKASTPQTIPRPTARSESGSVIEWLVLFVTCICLSPPFTWTSINYIYRTYSTQMKYPSNTNLVKYHMSCSANCKIKLKGVLLKIAHGSVFAITVTISYRVTDTWLAEPWKVGIWFIFAWTFC